MIKRLVNIVNSCNSGNFIQHCFNVQLDDDFWAAKLLLLSVSLFFMHVPTRPLVA